MIERLFTAISIAIASIEVARAQTEMFVRLWKLGWRPYNKYEMEAHILEDGIHIVLYSETGETYHVLTMQGKIYVWK